MRIYNNGGQGLDLFALVVALISEVLTKGEQDQEKRMEKRSPLLLLLSLLFSLFFLSCPAHIFGQCSNGEDEVQQNVSRSMFPHDFLFGAATSAYQIEGGYLEDGKGLSNWDVFTHIPGNVPNGDNGDVADDHFNRFMEDIENLQALGVDAYRFSISWARILPKGRLGEVNPNAVTFYNTIIDNLLLRGIQPFVTIHHNDMPQELEDRYGSWLSPLIQEDFVHFAKTCFENFGDRVKYWITMNEPNVYSIMAYILGMFPPGHCSPPYGNCSVGNSDLEPLIAGHNMVLSHAKAYKLYREQFQLNQSGIIGITVHAYNFEPYRDDEFCRQAAQRALAFTVAWMLDPLIYGDYPPLMRKYLGNDLPTFTKEETELLKGSVDFFGINHYSSLYAIDCSHYPAQCAPTDDRPIRGFTSSTGYRDGVPIGDEMGYERFFAVPDGMEKIMDYMRERYPNTTIYITENGFSPRGQDVMQDFKRIKYHQTYLAALAKAMRKGAKVKGYFAWTLMDNFEWLQGYTTSFGLYSVNRLTLERTPRLSAKWYTDFLANKTQNHDRRSDSNPFVLISAIERSSY